MNKFLSLRQVLAIVAMLVAAWLLYPVISGKKKPRAPEEVHVRIDSAPNNLNLFLNGGHAPSSFISRQIFQQLTDLDPKTLELKPTLVKTVPTVRQVMDGPRKGQFAYDFEIIPEAVWDNGTPVTANDVAFTLKLLFHPELPAVWRGYLSQLSGMEIDPANPKKFSLYFSSFYMLSLETICNTPIYPAYNYDAANRLTNIPFGDFLDTAKTSMLAGNANLKAFVAEFSQPKFANESNAISGSGPYRLEIMNEQGAVLVKKQNWWGDKVVEQYPMLAAYPKKLVYKVVKDDPTLENMIISGDLDLIGGVINPAKFLEMKANDSLNARYDFFTLGATAYNRWMLNHRNPILADVQVRQALTHIVDYDYFVNQVQRGMAVRISSPMPPDRPYYAKDIPLPDYNIAKARTMLEQAGWTDTDGNGILDKVINGKREQLSFRMMAATAVKTNELFANSLKESARQAGIELVVQSMDLSVMSADTRSGNYDSALLGVGLYPGQVEYNQRFHSKSLSPAGDNRALYISAKADSLIEAIRVQPDVAKRNALYLQIQQVFSEEIPEIVLFAPLQRIIISKKFVPGLESANRPGYYEHFARMKPE
ncbi:MAG: ABC transporter substrate-binding protein [Saprospiraceae bacterium]|nr:ABC transporter substrate-binding protein [Saprospiraceae bacterium]